MLISCENRIEIKDIRVLKDCRVSFRTGDSKARHTRDLLLCTTEENKSHYRQIQFNTCKLELRLKIIEKDYNRLQKLWTQQCYYYTFKDFLKFHNVTNKDFQEAHKIYNYNGVDKHV